jgi:uncharacterized protein with FMN-binding domain
MSELLRRGAPGLAIAGVALTGVWLFEPALHPDPEPTAATAVRSSEDGVDGPGDQAADDTTDDPSGAADATAEDPTGEATTAPSEPSSDCDAAEPVTGDAVMTRWGPVQVQMTFAPDGTVCAVSAVAYPDDDHHSARLNATAIPYLDAAARQVGTEFDAVTGATYTSEAYRQSMQSILDQVQ